ncbi:MAG: Calx-beta domain-containing protein, partial [Candidatus Aminicenantes bacterium]
MKAIQVCRLQKTLCFSVLALFFFFPSAVYSSNVSSVQTGEFSVSASSTSGSTTITSVADMGKTLLFYSLRENEDEPRDGSCRVWLSSANTISASRTSYENSITIRYYVVEFDSGVTVQRGNTSISSGTYYDVTLSPAVDLSESFVLTSALERDGSIFSEDDWFTARLTSSTNLRLQCYQMESGTISWQVVEFDGASVQRGETTMSTSDTYREVTIDSIDTLRSFLLCSTRQPDQDEYDIGANVILGKIENSTTIRFEKDHGSNSMTIAYEVVTLPYGTVQHSTQSVSSGTSQQDVTLSTPVDTSGSIAFASSQQLMGQSLGKTTYNSNDIPGVASFTHELVNSTTLRLQRNNTNGTSTVGWFVIDFTDPVIQFTSSSSNGSEGTTPANLQLSLSRAIGLDVTVDYAVTGGTATGSGMDYTLASGTATITAGNTTVNISATIVDDAVYEPNETVIVTISNPTNATLGSNTTHTYTINENESMPAIQFTSTSSVGDEGTTPANMQLTLSGVSSVNTTVDYAVTGGTATGGGTDYTLASGTATITAGNT